MATDRTSSPNAERPRVAYLLADPGITLADSRKGPSIHARSMIRAFVQEGCAVDVYAMRRGKGPLPEGADFRIVRRGRLTRWWHERWLKNELWRRWPGARRREREPNWMTAIGWRLWHRDFYREVARSCEKRRPTLLYARHAWFAWPYAALAKRLRLPLFLEVNALLTVEKTSYGQAAFAAAARRFEAEALRAAVRVMPVSAGVAKQVVALGGDPARTVVTPNAVDTDVFRPSEGGPEHGEGEFVIGAVNSMRSYHGMETLLRAAARLRPQMPRLRLLLIGGGPMLDELRALAGQLGLGEAAEFTGVIAHEEVARRLRECDVCVSPNEGDLNQYNCPMKLTEYMSMKIPIVASRWGEIPNIVEDGLTGLLHAPGDPDSLAEALREVHRNPQAARERADEAFARAQNHTWRSIARQVLSWAEAI
jgi:glycosyltransferase involved in cell wall biosynthesis